MRNPNHTSEYRLTIDSRDSDKKHPIACQHFSLDDLDSLIKLLKQEVADGFITTVEIVPAEDNCYDYDERLSGGMVGTTWGH